MRSTSRSISSKPRSKGLDSKDMRVIARALLEAASEPRLASGPGPGLRRPSPWRALVVFRNRIWCSETQLQETDGRRYGGDDLTLRGVERAGLYPGRRGCGRFCQWPDRLRHRSHGSAALAA